MKRVFFVDDEKGVLDGLRRMLRDMRSDWDMKFHTSAEDALQAMQSSPPEVVVSDMRMPGMDGAEFLERVQELYPSSIRFVLSGHAEMEQFSRAMRCSHQILTKPCDSDQLRTALMDAALLCRTMAAPGIADAVGGLGALPSIPAVIHELMDLLGRPEVDQAVIGRMVGRDPGLAVRVLQVANSGLFATRGGIQTIEQAVVLIGSRMLRNLILHAKIVEAFPVSNPSFSIDDFGGRMRSISKLARRLAPSHVSSEALCSLAMSTEVGQLVFAARLPDRFESVRKEVAATGAPVHKVEQKLFGATHADVGAYLLSLWGQPPHLVRRVATHHCPSEATDDRDLLTALHVAECLVDCDGDEARFAAALDPGLQIEADQAEAWLAQYRCHQE